jgi:hypothetical protein
MKPGALSFTGISVIDNSFVVVIASPWFGIGSVSGFLST